MTKIKDELFKLLTKIPKGKVTTYKSLAEKLKTSPRAVGRMLNTNTKLVIIPCHRVINNNGLIGGYKNGAPKKKALLRKEGVIFDKHLVSKNCIYKFL
ncbi:Methylated-DNA--protein-cysteine methyltransferase [Candidatus Tiddalikarchaeum anstoanum]|nr:Methylated-DNA--protein-cysteine methyltransferase [Candidatus Tiddalikarchaeum anstoanum]